MKLTIVSGGQTGADHGALRAAKAAGIATQGWAPQGWRTESGSAPWLADYGLRQCEVRGYPVRTERNIHDSHAMLWFGDRSSTGGRLTFELCDRYGRPTFAVLFDITPADVVNWLTSLWGATPEEVFLMVAGNRESRSPGIGIVTEEFMRKVFRLLKEGRP